MLAAAATDPRVTAAIESARDALAALATHPANRRGWPRSAAAAGIRSARASAALDGGSVELDPAADSVQDPVLAGAIRCAAAVGELASVFARSPLQALARLHVLAGADLVPADQLGRPRSGASPRLVGLAELIRGADLPAPVLSAVVHGEVLAASGFPPVDGVVARAAARLVTVSTGLDPHALGVPEVTYYRYAERYRTLAAGYATGSLEAVTEWLVFACRALRSGATEGRSIADAQGR